MRKIDLIAEKSGAQVGNLAELSPCQTPNSLILSLSKGAATFVQSLFYGTASEPP
jgi:hypothetical protein